MGEQQPFEDVLRQSARLFGETEARLTECRDRLKASRDRVQSLQDEKKDIDDSCAPCLARSRVDEGGALRRST